MVIACGKDDGYDPIDNQKPSAPINLRLTNTTESTISVSWDASTDDVAVKKYQVYLDGEIVAQNITVINAVIEDLCFGTPYNLYVTAFDEANNESDPSNELNASIEILPNEVFPQKLSELGVFTCNLSDLTPAVGVQLYEINSTLFSDYSHKQRLIRLPNEQSMGYNNNDLLPTFPDNTLISKTFFYNIDERDPSLGKKIIETRILLKVNGVWLVGDYIWNASQTEATYRETGSTEAISYIDLNGDTQNVDYQIPSKQDCFTCHNNNAETFPIGPKLRNLNFIPSYTSQNQLDYLASIGMLKGVTSSSTSVLPNWENENLLLDDRARAYMDVNCAHCHQPGGSVPSGFNLDFRFETDFNDTGIYANRGEITARFGSTLPTYRMPQLGELLYTVKHWKCWKNI